MKMKILGSLAVGLLAAAPTQQVLAVASQCDGVVGNLVTNCGFEAGSAVTGWTAGGTQGVAFGLAGLERTGTRGGILNFDAPGSAFISQSVGGPGTYDVSFWLGFYDSGIPNSDRVPQVSVVFGGQQLSVAPPSNQGVQTIVYGFFSFSNLAIVGPATLSFATSSQTGGIQYYDFLIDDVVVTARSVSPVPEPGTLALLGLGLAGLGLSRRRKAA